MDPVTLVLCLALFFIISYKNYTKKSVSEKIDILGGPKRYPVIGTSYEFMKCPREDLYATTTLRNKKYGPLFRTYIGNTPFVHVMKAEHAEIILKSNTHLRKGFIYDSVKAWLGDGLISTGNVQLWRHHRKLLTPSFHFNILDNFTEVFIEKSQMLVAQLQRKADGKYFNIFPYTLNCTLDIICETAMGVKVNAMNSTESEYIKATLGMSELVLRRLFNPFVKNEFIYGLTADGKKFKEYLNISQKFIDGVIKNKTSQVLSKPNLNELNEEDKLMGKKTRLAFLDLLIETNRHAQNLTDKEIREEVDTFMFAGHDTTASTTGFTIFALANHPEFQEKVHRELDEIFEDNKERPITVEDLHKMKYLEMCIKEALRYYTIVPTIGRVIEEEIVLDGHPIPPGIMVLIHLRDMHKDPEQFPNPEQFDPDNFLPERSANRHPYSFIPFSAGSRNCLGQKFAMKSATCILASVLRRFKLKALHKPEEMKFYGEIVLKPQQGIHIALEER